MLAAILVIFGGGLAWMRLVGDVAAGYGDPVSLVTAHSYDNSWYDSQGDAAWPYFRIPSVMATGLLVHRATTLGLPILVGAILLLVAGLPTRDERDAGSRDRPMLIFAAGLLGALLAPFHFFFFPAFGVVALLYVVIGRRLIDRDAPRNAVLLLAPFVLAIPFAVAPLLNASGSGALKFYLGWESAPIADGPVAVVFFYLTNLGVPFVLAIWPCSVARDLKTRAFLGAGRWPCSPIPNLMQVSDVALRHEQVLPGDVDRGRTAGGVADQALAVAGHRAGRAAALLPSPLLVAGWTAFNREQVLDWNGVEAANWIAANTPDRAVFATDGWLNSPTDPAGRLRLITYTPYIANLGFRS